MSAPSRAGGAALCSVCGATLSGRLDTFGEVWQPTCLACYVRFNEPETKLTVPDLDPFDTADTADEIDYEFDDEFIYRDGMTFCGACGEMAQPGEEEFDWCDHITGHGCYHMENSPWNDERDDDDDGGSLDDFEDDDVVDPAFG